MKKNLLPLISFCLTVLLLVVCIQQHMELKDYQAQIDFEMDSLRTELTNQMNHLAAGADTVPEETQGVDTEPEETQGVEEKPTVLPGYSVSEFTVDAINMENWMLEVYASVTLTETDDDMAVTLLAESNGETVSVPMNRYNSYSFATALSIPVDNYNEVAYTIQVEMNGKITQQDVYAYVDVHDLLPIYCGGTSLGTPFYERGRVYGQCGIYLDKRYGAPSPLPLLEPRFEVLRNGVVVQVLEAVHSGEWEEGISWPYYPVNDEFWNIEAQEGDQIVIRFLCHSESGIGWEFFVVAYEVRDGQVYNVELETWPRDGFYRAN
jgi:hypothetical protein